MSNTNQKIEVAIPKIKKILQFQFEDEVFDSVFNDPKEIKIEFSRKTKKFKLIFFKGKRFFSFKPDVGKFSLSIYAAKFLYDNTVKPKFRVTIQTDVQDFIKNGKSVFAKHAIKIAPHLRPNDEVIIVNEEDELLAVGKLKIPASDLYYNKSIGMAVDVRKGINKMK